MEANFRELGLVALGLCCLIARVRRSTPMCSSNLTATVGYGIAVIRVVLQSSTARAGKSQAKNSTDRAGPAIDAFGRLLPEIEGDGEPSSNC